MKKLILILIAGLLLSGCFHKSDEDLVEKCANQEFQKSGATFKDDPLNIRNKTLKNKLEDLNYSLSWSTCEKSFQLYPMKFRIRFGD